MENEKKIALSKAVEIAVKEGLEEDAVYVRANEIAADSILEQPLTEEGIEVKAFVKETLENPDVPSPFVQTTFDYNKFRDDTTNVALREILGLFSKYPDLVPSAMGSSEEAVERMGAAYEKFSLELFEVFNKNNVRLEDYAYAFAVLKTMISTLDDTMQAQVKGHRNEILARVVGSKNPGTGKMDFNFATYGDLTKTVESVREATGGNMEDYFHVNKS